jgi:hypothetical protein
MRTQGSSERQLHYEEIPAKSISGMLMLVLNIVLTLGALFGFVYGIIHAAGGAATGLRIGLIAVCALYAFLIGPILFAGLKILQPNEALVLTLFGKYYGTLRGEGFFFVNPFVSAVNPAAESAAAGAAITIEPPAVHGKASNFKVKRPNKKISLKSMTLNNEKQKINDELGNPIIIGIVVIWKVVNTAKAVFNVDNYVEFLSIQCDSSLRNIVRLYPYSVLHGVTPLSKERGLANRMTALALMEISRTAGARCCKRDVMVALATAKRHFAELDHTVGSKYVCEQYPQNKQCIRSECPYYPG